MGKDIPRIIIRLTCGTEIVMNAINLCGKQAKNSNLRIQRYFNPVLP